MPEVGKCWDTVRWLAIGGAIVAVLSWPFAYRYTSLGLDLERQQDGRIGCTFYRLRWPGDGSVALAWIVEHRELASGALEPFDLGARFLQPVPGLAANGFWQQHGFWWVCVDERAPAPPIVAGADRALRIGIPHWLVVAVSFALLLLTRRRVAGGG